MKIRIIIALFVILSFFCQQAHALDGQTNAQDEFFKALKLLEDKSGVYSVYDRGLELHGTKILLSKSKKDKPGKPYTGCDILISSPVFWLWRGEDLKGDVSVVNSLVSDYIKEKLDVKHITCSKYYYDRNAYNVTLATKSIVSINMVESFVQARGGMGDGYIPINIDIKQKKILTLDALFNNANYISIINELLKSSFKEPNDLFSKKNGIGDLYSFKTITAKQAFYLTEKNLVICFQQYEITAGAAGIIEVSIPLEKVRKYFNPVFAL